MSSHLARYVEHLNLIIHRLTLRSDLLLRLPLLYYLPCGHQNLHLDLLSPDLLHPKIHDDLYRYRNICCSVVYCLNHRYLLYLSTTCIPVG